MHWLSLCPSEILVFLVGSHFVYCQVALPVCPEDIWVRIGSDKCRQLPGEVAILKEPELHGY